jgi:copper chaperone
MPTEQFTVRNVKCGGCVSAIENGLRTLAEVNEVSVTIDGGLVKVSGESLDRTRLAQKLTELGYPEA